MSRMQTQFRPKVVSSGNMVSVKGLDWTLQIRKITKQPENKILFLLKLVRCKYIPDNQSFVYEDLHDPLWLTAPEYSRLLYALVQVAKDGEPRT